MIEKYKAEINIQNDAGTTPLFQAVSANYFAIAMFLLQKGTLCKALSLITE
jgi:ankyrin repeat protein